MIVGRRIDHREKPGYIACTIAVSYSILYLLSFMFVLLIALDLDHNDV